MDKKALAQQLLDGFGKTLTVGALALDEYTSSCVLIFDEQLVINIEYDEQTQRLVLSSYLHELPATGAEPLLRELLAAFLVRLQGFFQRLQRLVQVEQMVQLVELGAAVPVHVGCVEILGGIAARQGGVVVVELVQHVLVAGGHFVQGQA